MAILHFYSNHVPAIHDCRKFMDIILCHPITYTSLLMKVVVIQFGMKEKFAVFDVGAFAVLSSGFLNTVLVHVKIWIHEDSQD